MIKDDMAVIDGVIVKDQCIVMPETLQWQALKQLHVNHMGTDQTKLLAPESMYWVGMYAGIENHIKFVLHTFLSANQAKRNKSYITTSLANHKK